MKIILNGKEFFNHSNNMVTIPDILALLPVHPSSLAIQINNITRLRKYWNSYKIKENDIVEIIEIIAGG